MKRVLVASLATLLPCLAWAQGNDAYQCTFGELQRRVEIFSEPGRSVPCEVHYYKDTEAPGERQVLWSASSQEGYCAQKTEEFIAKLQGWGWECSAGAAAAPERAPEAAAVPEPAPEPEAGSEPESAVPEVDDTEALAPAGDAE